LNRCSVPAAICSILLLLSATGAARETGNSVPVRLAEAVSLAIKSRPEPRIELEKENIARSKVKEARGNFFPTLDFLASSHFVENFDTFTGIDISAQIADQNVLVNVTKEVPAYQLNDELSFSYNLFAGGRDTALLAEALSNLESAKHQEVSALRKIELEVTKAYWGLRKAQLQYAIANRSFEVARLELKVAETKHKVDRISEVEHHEVLLKSREKELSLKIADRDCLKAFSSYMHVLGLPEDGMAPSSDELPGLLDEPDDEERVVGEATSHPELERIKSELRAAAEREKAARSENYPKIDFFARYSMVGRDSDYYFGSYEDARSEYYLVGLKVTLNLFNGFRTKERINQADADMRVKRLQLMQKQRDLAEAENVRKTAVETAKDELSLAIERRRLEDARRKAARSDLQCGRISELEYRQKTADSENAADKVLMARIDVALAWNALKLMVLE
jgi:adhesin transport system outer membrane protein